ncbi:MAG: FAD-binding oxidoreductase [Gemmatimonadetes bacterium]|nr:FAD-binding oxidoreductase [Gemmatimonadota bacterium]
MDRREFCRTAVAAGVAGSFPWFYGCEASEAERSIAAVSLDGAEIELERAAIRELGESLSGTLMLSDHPEYETARRIWNGMHDRRPALIARCLNTQDVSQAVTFARERELLVAVRGGGHSWPGKSVCEGGLMIDLSHMNTVRVDAAQQRAHAQGGALLFDLDTAAREHGLITTTGVISHTGIGGFTLGGGFGRPNRKFGLAIDNLRSAEIVTADGQIRRISEEAEPDLFWAIRGGDGNFGVVTAFEYQLHPMALQVLCGTVVWPIEQAREVLDFYAGWYAALSDELYVGPAMMTMPDGVGVIAMEVAYTGDPAAGEREVAPLLRIGTPIDNGVGLNDYMAMQTQSDELTHPGIRSYAKNGMVREVTQGMVDAMIESYRPDPRLLLASHTAGGAVSRVGELDTAFPHRNAQTMLVFASFWEDPAQDEEAIAATRNWYNQLEPFMGGYYQNIEFEIDETAGNYGPAYRRLSEVKGRYDPMNLFRLNSNVLPAV